MLAALFDTLRFHNPDEGEAVTSDDVFELISQQTLYQEGYMYGGGDPVSQGPWNVPHLQYLYQREANGSGYRVPPNGMRSAVPLGPVGGGTVELRADGGLRDWRLLNNQPHGFDWGEVEGECKVDVEGATFALWSRPLGDSHAAHAALLRTHPPAALPGIQRSRYDGAFPVSRLQLDDELLDLSSNRSRLYAFSSFKMHDANESNLPVVWFAFDLQLGANTTELAAMFTLPAAVLGDGSSFRFDNTSASASAPGRLVLSQPNATSQRFGELVVSVFGVQSDGAPLEAIDLSWQATGNLSAMFASFADDGRLESSTDVRAGQGGVAMRLLRPPAKGRVILFFSLAWRLPRRMWAGGEVIGQQYSVEFPSTADVVAAAEDVGRVESALRSALRLHELYFNNSFPVWLQDALTQSVASFGKTGMWLADGRWRQFESFACPQLEPPHIHAPRALAALHLFPALARSSLSLYLRNQVSGGLVSEDFAGPPIDTPNGQPRGDDNAVVLLEVFAK